MSLLPAIASVIAPFAAQIFAAPVCNCKCSSEQLDCGSATEPLKEVLFAAVARPAVVCPSVKCEATSTGISILVIIFLVFVGFLVGVAVGVLAVQLLSKTVETLVCKDKDVPTETLEAVDRSSTLVVTPNTRRRS